MINKILSLLLKLIVWIFTTIVSIVTMPLNTLIQLIFPDMSSWTASLSNFINDYIFTGARFMKMVFLNATHFPSELFGIAITIMLGAVTFYFAGAAIRFLKNAYGFVKRG